MFSYATRRSGGYDNSAVVSISSSARAGDWVPTSWLTRRKDCSMDRPDSTQISIRSSASGQARRIDNCRFVVRFLRNSSGDFTPRKPDATTIMTRQTGDNPRSATTNRYNKEKREHPIG